VLFGCLLLLKPSSEEMEEEEEEEIQQEEEGVVNAEEEQEQVVEEEAPPPKKRRRNGPSKKSHLVLGEDGEIDLTRTPIKDIIRYGGNIGKPMKKSLDKENTVSSYSSYPLSTLIQDTRIKKTTSSTSDTWNKENKQEEERSIPLDEYAPQVTIDSEGNMVLNEESLTITAADSSQREEFDVVFESNTHVTSNSFTNRKPTEKWTKEETDKFYTALCQHGTDFTLIQKHFPNRTRRQIKNKFKKEERANPQKIDDALSHRLPVGMNLCLFVVL
jgi:hypothetical protein